MSSDPAALDSREAVHAVVGPESSRIPLEISDLFDETAHSFAAASPFSRLAIRVRVEAVLFHCAKAFGRSELWRPEAWPALLAVSLGRPMAKPLAASREQPC